jgi:hypothetical protein
MGLNSADRVWNRAALENGGTNPRPGDEALRDLLLAHGMAMNGSVFHCVEALPKAELDAAIAGYHYFGCPRVATLLLRATRVPDPLSEDDLSDQFDLEYGQLIPSDQVLIDLFNDRFAERPGDFAPLD